MPLEHRYFIYDLPVGSRRGSIFYTSAQDYCIVVLLYSMLFRPLPPCSGRLSEKRHHRCTLPTSATTLRPYLSYARTSMPTLLDHLSILFVPRCPDAFAPLRHHSMLSIAQCLPEADNSLPKNATKQLDTDADLCSCQLVRLPVRATVLPSPRTLHNSRSSLSSYRAPRYQHLSQYPPEWRLHRISDDQ